MFQYKKCGLNHERQKMKMTNYGKQETNKKAPFLAQVALKKF